MENKIKFIIIALLVILAISIFINLQTLNSKKLIQRERDALKTENLSLVKQIEESRKDRQRLDEKIASLNSDLDKLSQQNAEVQNRKDELERQYALLLREKSDLDEKLKGYSAKPKEKTDLQVTTEDTYWAGVLKSKTDLEVQLESIRRGLRTAQINSEQLKKEKEELGAELQNLAREKDDMEQQLKAMDSMAFELVREKNTKIKIQDELRNIKRENYALKRTLKNVSSYKDKLEDKVRQLQDEKANLERRFSEMGLLLENKLSQIDDIKQQMDVIRSGGQAELSPPNKESIDLSPIYVHPQGAESTPQETVQIPLSGRIISVDRENNFVIIDLGEDSGVSNGDIFQVYRQDQAIATIEIIQVRKSVSACDIKGEISPIMAGDKIR